MSTFELAKAVLSTLTDRRVESRGALPDQEIFLNPDDLAEMTEEFSKHGATPRTLWGCPVKGDEFLQRGTHAVLDAVQNG